MVLALVVLLLRHAVSHHEEFGQIKRTKMREPHPPRKFEELISKAQAALRLTAMDTRKYSYLQVGEAKMEWSLMNSREKTGWLYFHSPEPNQAFWEFAPCRKSNLQDLSASDLEVEFVQKGDTGKIRNHFDCSFWLNKEGRSLSGRAIPVKEGQLLLARHKGNTNTIYAVQLVDQEGASDWGSIGVEYLTIDIQEIRSQ